MRVLDRLRGKEEMTPEGAEKLPEREILRREAEQEEAVMKVEGIYHSMEAGLVVEGTVVSGVVKPGHTTRVQGKVGKVGCIVMEHKNFENVLKGESAGICLNNFSEGDLKAGDVLKFAQSPKTV